MKTLKDSYAAYLMMYFFYYCSTALFTVLTAVYVIDKGYTSQDVAMVVASGLALNLVTGPIIGHLNDRYGIVRINSALIALSGLGSIIFAHMPNIWLMTVFYAVVYSLLNGTAPAIEKMATTSRFRYGHIRIWGTIGYSFGTFLGGFIYASISPAFVFYLYALTMLLAIVGLVNTKEHAVEGQALEEQKPAKMADLFKIKPYVLYMIIVGLFYGAMNVSATHIPAMLKADGLAVDTVSLIISAAVLVELPLVLFSHLFMDKVKSKLILAIILTLMVVQFSVYAFVPSILAKVLVTLLFKHTLGMTYIMTNLKVVRFMVPLSVQISALALVATTANICSVIFQSFAGPLIDAAGYASFYSSLAGLIVLALVLLKFLKVKDIPGIKLFS